MALRVGLLLALIGTAVWLAIPVAPLVAETAAEAGILASALWVGSEVLFWGGVALAGKDAWSTVRSNPWRRVPGVLWSVMRDGRV